MKSTIAAKDIAKTLNKYKSTHSINTFVGLEGFIVGMMCSPIMRKMQFAFDYL